MIYVGYVLGHSQDCYQRYNPCMQQIHVTWDITWLQCMNYTKLDDNNSIELAINPVLPWVSDSWEDEQLKYLPDSSTNEGSFHKGNANLMTDADEDGF